MGHGVGFGAGDIAWLDAEPCPRPGKAVRGHLGLRKWEVPSVVEVNADERTTLARRTALVQLREELSEVVQSTAEGARPVDLEEPIGRISRVDAMQQQKMVAENRQAAQRRRRQVEAAITRIDEGDYGECLGCGEEIDPRRLEAHPEAPLCIECQGQRERKG